MSGQAHVLVALLTISSLLFILRLVRRRQMRAKYSVLWLSLGVVMAVLAVSPSTLDRVSLALGISYGPTTLFLAGLALLLLVAVHFSWELSRLEERTRRLAEEVAILRAERVDRSPGDPASQHDGVAHH
jgi:hypothetical protein